MDTSEICRICGIKLAEQHQPWARLSWPPMLLPGDVASRDELCDECAAAVGDSSFPLVEERLHGAPQLSEFDHGGGLQRGDQDQKQEQQQDKQGGQIHRRPA